MHCLHAPTYRITSSSNTAATSLGLLCTKGARPYLHQRELTGCGKGGWRAGCTRVDDGNMTCTHGMQKGGCGCASASCRGHGWVFVVLEPRHAPMPRQGLKAASKGGSVGHGQRAGQRHQASDVGRGQAAQGSPALTDHIQQVSLETRARHSRCAQHMPWAMVGVGSG